MLLIVLIPLQVTFAPLPPKEANQSDFSRLNHTGNKSELSGNTTTNASDFSGNLIVDPQAKQLDFIEENRSMSDFSGNMTQAEPQDFTTTEDYSGNMTHAEPIDSPDLLRGNCDAGYSSTACLIAQDLISLSADEIATYGLGDNPNYVIEQALNSMDSGNLTKVLQSISPHELTSIKDKLTPQTFETILSKVPEPQHTELLSKVSLPP